MDLMKVTAYLVLDSNQYEEGLQQATGKLSGFTGKGAALFGAFAEVGKRAMSSVFSAVSSSMDGAVKRLDTLNNFARVMDNIGLSGGAETIDELAEGIQKLPTTLDAVAAETQQVAAVTKDLGGAKDIVLALNNALAAGGVSGAEAEGAITQWVQAMAKGKPDYTEWMRLVQSSPAQMDQLAQSILGAGKTTGDLWDEIKEGTVSIDELNAEMVELATNGNPELGFTDWATQAESASDGIQMSTLNIRAAMERNIANVIQGISTGLSDFGGIAGILQGIVPAIDSIGDRLTKLATGEMSIGDFLSFDVSGLLQSIDEGLPQLLEKGLEWAEGFTTSLREGFGNLVSNGIEIVQHIAQGLADGMPVMVEKIPTIVSNIAGLINDNLPKLLAAGFNIIVTLGKGLIQAIPTIVANIPQILKAIWDVMMAFNWLKLGKGIITAIGNGIKALSTSLPAALKRAGSSAVKSLKGINWKAAGKNIIQLIATAAKAAGGMLKAALKALGRAAVQAFKGVNWKELGINLVKGIVRGVVGMAGTLGNAIKNLVKNAFKKGKEAADSHSPSRLFRYGLGEPIGQGVALGVEDTIPLAAQAVEDMVNEMAGTAPFAISANIPDSFVDDTSLVREELSIEFGKQIAELGAYLQAGMVDAVEGLSITLDKRQFGRATRKAVNFV